MRGLWAIALVALACSPEKEEAHYLRVVVATDLMVPDELEAFSVRVTKDDAVKFEQNFDQAALLSLPNDVVLEEDSATFVAPSNEPLLPVVQVQVTGYRAGDPVVWQSAGFFYGNGKVQVPMPLCFDCLMTECPDGRCVHGSCESDFVAKSSLPKDEGSMIDPLSSCGPR
jgi:hypothetical protein